MSTDSAADQRLSEREAAGQLRRSFGDEVGVKTTSGLTVEGRVESVAATDAFAVVDGWHIPLATVVGIERL